MDDWIDVNEGLPGPNQLVLATSTKYKAYDLVVYENISGVGIWIGDRLRSWHDIDESYGKQTHWMYLPLPPDDESTA